MNPTRAEPFTRQCSIQNRPRAASSRFASIGQVSRLISNGIFFFRFYFLFYLWSFLWWRRDRKGLSRVRFYCCCCCWFALVHCFEEKNCFKKNEREINEPKTNGGNQPVSGSTTRRPHKKNALQIVTKKNIIRSVRRPRQKQNGKISAKTRNKTKR